MRKDLTDIMLIVDRSSSMDSCKDEAQSGINAFIKEQKEQDGECRLTLVEFDSEYNVVHDTVPIGEVPDYTLVPRGMTALYDALGKAINSKGASLCKMKEEDRPGLVVCLIVTDGAENSSHEFTQLVIKKMITTQETEFNWKFTFLAANIDAADAGSAIGVSSAATASFTVNNSQAAYSGASSNITRMRSCSMNDESVVNAYTPDEKSSMVDEKTDTSVSIEESK